MRKIFSLPTISIAAAKGKPSEFYSHDVADLMDYANSSVDLTDEKRVKLEKLQSRLSALYEELDQVMIREEELTVLNYRNKKRKIEPVSNFKSSLESLKALKLENKCSSSKSLCIDNLKDNYGDSEPVEPNGDDELDHNAPDDPALRRDLSPASKEPNDAETHKDELDYNSNYNDLTSRNDVQELVFSKFYFPLSETNLSSHLNAEQSHLNVDQSHLSVDQPHLKVDKHHLTVDQPHRSVDKSNLSVDQHHRSVDKSHLNVDQSQSDSRPDEASNPKADKQLSRLLDKEPNRLDKNDSKTRRKVVSSRSFNVINRNKPVNSPIIEQDENSPTPLGHSASEPASLLTKKINLLKQKLSNVVNENDKLKTALKKTTDSEKEMKQNCRRMEEKLAGQKAKIEQLQSRLTESVSSHNKLKVEHEQFRAEMQREREKFTSFVMQEKRREARGNEQALQQKLKEKDQLIASLLGEIDDLKMNLKNKHLTIETVEKNKVLSSQQLHLDQAIRNISIYQTNNVPELLMISLEDSSSQLHNLPAKGHLTKSDSSNRSDRWSAGQLADQLNKSNPSNGQLSKSSLSTNLSNGQLNQSARSGQESLYSDQSTAQLNGTLKQFCDQINLLQKEFSSVVDEEEKRSFMLKIEEFVLKNMRKLVVDKVDSFFDSLQLYLAQLKFEIIQFAVESEQQRQSYPNNKKSKSPFVDRNNNSSFNKPANTGLRNLRNNLQSRTVERRMVELRRSIETYLKSYLVRILLEMQDQAN